MGKIVKYCSSCDEGFSEKFGFCPNCAAPLQAFEMNPLDGSPKIDEPVVDLPAATENDFAGVTAASVADDTILDLSDDGRVEVSSSERFDTVEDISDVEPIEVANADVIDDAEPAEKSVVGQPVWVSSPKPAAPATSRFEQPEETRDYAPSIYTRDDDDGGYYVTVIQEKNGTQRNMLLLGALIFMVTVSFAAYIISMFQKDIFVGSIGDNTSLAMLLDDVPMPIEDEPEIKKKDDGGGGGGGGKNDPKPVNRGDLPDQTPDPIRPPDPKVPRLSDPSIVLPPPSTQGNVKTEKKYGQWGDPNSKFGDLSSGPGSGGGMGTGIGTGAGSGRGTGMGSGTGSGSGSGFGNGNGDGTGNGDGIGGPPPKPPVGVTSAVKILSKPQAKYNDQGRTQGVQGSVRLKVTLLANGSVGSITPVTRLPAGLTEQAIAAARLIRFEPKKVNGQPVATTVTIDYSFSIY